MDETFSEGEKAFQERMTLLVAENVKRIVGLWDQMGIENRQNRMDVVTDYVDKSFARMIKEEQGHLRLILKEIESLQKRKYSLLRELRRTSVDEEEDLAGLPLVKLVQVLRESLQELEASKEEEMREVRKLLEDDRESSDWVARAPMPFPEDTILTAEEIADLKNHTRDAKLLRRRRLAQLEGVKLEIESLCQRLDAAPQSATERKMICDDGENCVLSDDNMAAVEKLLERLRARLTANGEKMSRMVERIGTLCGRLGHDKAERLPAADDGLLTDAVLKKVEESLDELELAKRQHMEKFVAAAREELEAAWNKCYFGSVQRREFGEFFAKEAAAAATEEVLDAHEKELEKVRRFYADNEALFNTVDEWHSVWCQKMELENRAKDPNRLFNCRKNNLLQEEKERKEVQRQLPRVEKELLAMVEQFDDANPGRLFRLDGLPFALYVAKQKQEHGSEVNYEKSARKELRKKMTQHESVYGSKPLKSINMTAAALMKSRRDVVLSASKSAKRPQASTLPDAKRRKLQDSVITGNLGQQSFKSVDSTAAYRDKDVISSTFCDDTKRVTRAALATPSRTQVTTPNKSTFKTPRSGLRTLTSSRILPHGGAQGRNLRNLRKVPFKL